MAAPCVYTAICAVTAEIGQCGVAKSHTNPVDDYRYRSIDDVIGALSPLLAKHRLCVLPRVLERHVLERQGTRESLLLSVALRVAFELVSAEDGSTHQVEAYGEALDAGDKATAKAMSAAYKSAMLQTFCIPAGNNHDADGSSHKLHAKIHASEPVQGWEQWALDIGDIVNVCETQDAISLVQDRNRALLLALSRERPDFYSELGATFTARLEFLRDRQPEATRRPAPSRTRKAPSKPRPMVEVQHG